MIRYLAPILFAFQGGCVTVDVFVPPEAPATMEINWQRVGYFNLQSRCGAPPHSPIYLSSIGSRPVAGCAIRNGNVCTIWTTDRVFLETVGHEVVLHCFLGVQHRPAREQRQELSPVPIGIHK